MKTEIFTCDFCGKEIEGCPTAKIFIIRDGYYMGSPNQVYYEYHVHKNKECLFSLTKKLEACPRENANHKYGKLYVKGSL